MTWSSSMRPRGRGYVVELCEDVGGRIDQGHSDRGRGGCDRVEWNTLSEGASVGKTSLASGVRSAIQKQLSFAVRLRSAPSSTDLCPRALPEALNTPFFTSFECIVSNVWMSLTSVFPSTCKMVANEQEGKRTSAVISGAEHRDLCRALGPCSAPHTTPLCATPRVPKLLPTSTNGTQLASLDDPGSTPAYGTGRDAIRSTTHL